MKIAIKSNKLLKILSEERLSKAYYERSLWHPLLKKVFPYLIASNRTRKYVKNRFEQIRKLRNRVFHHQRIWHIEDLQDQKNHIFEAIHWMEPVACEYLECIENFDEIFKRGKNHYIPLLAQILKDTP